MILLFHHFTFPHKTKWLTGSQSTAYRNLGLILDKNDPTYILIHASPPENHVYSHVSQKGVPEMEACLREPAWAAAVSWLIP